MEQQLSETAPTHEAIHLQPSQKAAAVEVLARAFMDDVTYAYVLPDPDERAKAMRRLWVALVDYTQLFGEVYTTPALGGVACWLPPGKTSYGLWPILRTGFALPRAVLSFGKQGRDRMTDAMRYNDQVRDRVIKAPHWYLGALAVDPAHQHRGIGSCLLQPVLARADARSVPCYLETQTEDNVRFYEKHGFEIANAGEVPGHPLKMWAMLRRPRP